MQKFIKQKNKGFTLVETLVGLLIFTIAIVSVMSVLGSGLQNTTYAQQKIVAQYLAQEGIEFARNYRDTFLLHPELNGNTWGGPGGFVNLPDYEITPPAPYDTRFSRTVQMFPSSNADEVKIVSTVTWMQGSGQKTVTFSENLYNWIEYGNN